jgi:hypothetical protein
MSTLLKRAYRQSITNAIGALNVSADLVLKAAPSNSEEYQKKNNRNLCNQT